MIVGNTIGGHPIPPKTVIFQTSDGQELPAVLVDTETVFTATTNDVREGKTFASDSGVKTGTKVIPTYHTFQGTRLIPKGGKVTIPNIDSKMDDYDYTELQSIICSFNRNLAGSVAAQKVVIENNVYNVQSTESIAMVTKNHNTKIVDLGITNDSDTNWVNRFFMYKEMK